MRTLLFVLALLPATSHAAGVADVAWLKGCWRTAGKSTVTETWIAPPAPVMFGQAVTRENAKTVFWEDLRIEERDGALVYIAMPAGRDPVRFPLYQNEPNRVVFENLAHDYPKRIAYSRKGNELTAITSAGDRFETFTYRRINCPPAYKP